MRSAREHRTRPGGDSGPSRMKRSPSLSSVGIVDIPRTRKGGEKESPRAARPFSPESRAYAGTTSRRSQTRELVKPADENFKQSSPSSRLKEAWGLAQIPFLRRKASKTSLSVQSSDDIPERSLHDRSPREAPDTLSYAAAGSAEASDSRYKQRAPQLRVQVAQSRVSAISLSLATSETPRHRLSGASFGSVGTGPRTPFTGRLSVSPARAGHSNIEAVKATSRSYEHRPSSLLPRSSSSRSSLAQEVRARTSLPGEASLDASPVPPSRPPRSARRLTSDLHSADLVSPDGTVLSYLSRPTNDTGSSKTASTGAASSLRAPSIQGSQSSGSSGKVAGDPGLASSVMAGKGLPPVEPSQSQGLLSQTTVAEPLVIVSPATREAHDSKMRATLPALMEISVASQRTETSGSPRVSVDWPSSTNFDQNFDLELERIMRMPDLAPFNFAVMDAADEAEKNSEGAERPSDAGIASPSAETQSGEAAQDIPSAQGRPRLVSSSHRGSSLLSGTSSRPGSSSRPLSSSSNASTYPQIRRKRLTSTLKLAPSAMEALRAIPTPNRSSMLSSTYAASEDSLLADTAGTGALAASLVDCPADHKGAGHGADAGSSVQPTHPEAAAPDKGQRTPGHRRGSSTGLQSIDFVHEISQGSAFDVGHLRRSFPADVEDESPMLLNGDVAKDADHSMEMPETGSEEGDAGKYEEEAGAQTAVLPRWSEEEELVVLNTAAPVSPLLDEHERSILEEIRSRIPPTPPLQIIKSSDYSHSRTPSHSSGRSSGHGDGGAADSSTHSSHHGRRPQQPNYGLLRSRSRQALHPEQATTGSHERTGSRTPSSNEHSYEQDDEVEVELDGAKQLLPNARRLTLDAGLPSEPHPARNYSFL